MTVAVVAVRQIADRQKVGVANTVNPVDDAAVHVATTAHPSHADTSTFGLTPIVTGTAAPSTSSTMPSIDWFTLNV